MARKHTRTRGTKDSYTGRSGQRAVMAELLFRECNAAIPDVDTGEDLFAFRDDREEIARIQVKTAAHARRYRNEAGYRVQFGIPVKQLRMKDSPPLHYILAVRLEGQWVDFVVISRTDLLQHWNGAKAMGTENTSSGDLVLTLQFRPGSLRCGDVDLQEYRNAWEKLPPLNPIAGLGPTSRF